MGYWGYCGAIVLGVTEVPVDVPFWGNIGANGAIGAIGAIGAFGVIGAIGAIGGAIGGAVVDAIGANLNILFTNGFNLNSYDVIVKKC